MTHFDFNFGWIEKERRFSDKYFMDGNFLFEDLMDDFPDAVTSGLDSRSAVDDELYSDGLYEGEDALPWSINVKYVFYSPVAKVQGFGKSYEKIMESFKSLEFAARKRIDVYFQDSSVFSDDVGTVLTNADPEEFEETLKDQMISRRRIQMKLSFDVEPSCTRMRFYRGMLAIQKAMRDFSHTPSIQFRHVTDEGVFVRRISATVTPDKNTVDSIYDEIYSNSQNNVSDEVYDRKIRKFNTTKYVHHITVLARISANPAQYEPLKMRFLGTMAHLFYGATVSEYKNFVEFYSDDPDVPLSTNDMIAFIVRYVIPHINAEDMKQVRADDVPEVGSINFYVIASDRDVRNPESTEFRFEMSARDDERVKFRVIVLNERLVEVEKGPDGRKTATGEPILSELALESLKERFKRKFEML